MSAKVYALLEHIRNDVNPHSVSIRSCQVLVSSTCADTPLPTPLAGTYLQFSHRITCTVSNLFCMAGPVNLPPDSIGLRAAMRKTHSYQWLEAACAPEATNPETGGSHPCSVSPA